MILEQNVEFIFLINDDYPPKFYRPFLPTAPLQYVPKILFTQATINLLTANKTKIVLHNETIILNYISGDLISHGLSN